MEFPSKTLQPLKYQIPLEGGGHSNVPFNQRAGSIPPCSFLLVQIRAIMKQHQKAARLSDILLKRAAKGNLKMVKNSVQPSGILPPANSFRTDSIATLRSARLLLCGDIPPPRKQHSGVQACVAPVAHRLGLEPSLTILKSQKLDLMPSRSSVITGGGLGGGASTTHNGDCFGTFACASDRCQTRL